ncbi:hypothetical protein ACSBR2_002708 [Camellia fascicularis]
MFLLTGVWPESLSFNPDGLGPVPNRFRGECETREKFSECNSNNIFWFKKIIGARYYCQGYEQDQGPLESDGQWFFRSARDDFRHGSHTASTAAGSLVNDYTIPGVLDTQTARGGAPNARLAIYKAGKSVAKSSNYDYADDVFTISTFHAFMQGILTSASAGNEGRFGSSTVTNSAPWVLTVAASVDNRDFVSTVQLGNGGTLEGYGLNRFQMDDFNGVIKASYAALFGVSTEDAKMQGKLVMHAPYLHATIHHACVSCKRNSLDTGLIQGKIVVCTMGSWNDDKATMGIVVSNGGGVGIIVVYPNDVKSTEIYNIPTSVITPKEAKMLQEYLISAR